LLTNRTLAANRENPVHVAPDKLRLAPQALQVTLNTLCARGHLPSV
jgi:hypothetical protein